jgi:alkylresorcinol/alkylpyrone synthase
MARISQGNRVVERLLPVFDRAGVERRYLLHAPKDLARARPFAARNRDYQTHGLELATRAVASCLDDGGVSPAEVAHLYFVTTTGLATPSLDARLAGRLGFPARIRRSPLFGLGCAGGAGALARASDVLRAAPRERALVVSLELCSLVFTPAARTPTDVVGAALFGDGAAAVLVAGDDVATGGPSVRCSRTELFPDAPDLMGWDFTDDGMRLVLAKTIPTFVSNEVAPVVDRFLSDHDLRRDDLDHYLLHPGGPRIMDAYRTALGVPEEALWIARETMREYGNLSSAAVLFMLHRLRTSGRAAAGDGALMVALGPGFAAEMLVLSW